MIVGWWKKSYQHVNQFCAHANRNETLLFLNRVSPIGSFCIIATFAGLRTMVMFEEKQAIVKAYSQEKNANPSSTTTTHTVRTITNDERTILLHTQN